MVTWQNVTVKLSDLKPWSENPRTMTKKQAQRLLKSWSDLGQFQTIAIGPLVQNGDGKSYCQVYDGHQRLSALLAAHGPQFAIDARQADRELSDDERRELTIQANLPAGSWNWDALSGWDAAQLQEWGFDQEALKAWNTDASNLAMMLTVDVAGDADAEPQIDRAEELNKKWQVKTADLWRIGEHRLLCGDSTKREDVERVMAQNVAETIFTSPPYADMREYNGGNLSVEHLSSFIPTWKDFSNFQAINLGIKRTDNEIVEYWNEYIRAGRECGYKLLSWNVWDKGEAGGPSNQLAMFSIEHEFIFVFGEASKMLVRTEEKKHKKNQKPKLRRQPDGALKRSSTGQNYKYKNAPTIFRTYGTEHGSIRAFHPATMPVELPTLYIKAMTNEDDIVSDPFAGSGTTLVACQNLQRKCRAIEISPNYCAVILERMATAFPSIEIERIAEI